MDTNPYDDFQRSYRDLAQNQEQTVYDSQQAPPILIDYDPTVKMDPAPRQRTLKLPIRALATLVIVAIVGIIGVTHEATGGWPWQHTTSGSTIVAPTATVSTAAAPSPLPTNGSATIAPQPTSGATPLSCAQTLPNSSAATTGSTKVSIDFPAQTVTASWEDRLDTTTGYQQRVIPACTPNSSTATILNAFKTLAGWLATTSAVGCGNDAAACITKTITVSNASVAEFASITQVQDVHGMVRYTIILAIAPLAHQDTTPIPTASTPYWSFSDPTPTQYTADLQYSNGSITLANSALLAYQPGKALSVLTNTYCATINVWDYHPGDTIAIKPGIAACLQASSGKYVAILYTSQTTFQWSEFLFGF